MNFGHHYFIRKALLCLLGWGIFLVPMRVWGSLDTHGKNAGENAGENSTPTQSAIISFKEPNEFSTNAQADLRLYETLSKQLGDNKKELEKILKWEAGPLTEKAIEEKKQELEEEKKTILEQSSKVLERIVKCEQKIDKLRKDIAVEDLPYFDKVMGQLEKLKKEHQAEFDLAKAKLEIEDLKTKKRTPAEQKEYEKKVGNLKDSILNYLENNPHPVSNQFAEKLLQTLEELERHEQQFRNTEENKPSSPESYTPYQAQYKKPSVPEETPHSDNSESKRDDNAAKKSGSNSETNSAGSVSGKSASGSSPLTTQSRGSAGESTAKHSTEDEASSSETLSKNTAETVADNHDKINYANSFRKQPGGLPQTAGAAVSTGSNAAGAGPVATPTSPLAAASVTSQPPAAGRAASTAGTTNYTIYNNGDSKQGSPSNAGATTKPTVNEQQTGSAPSDLKSDLSGSRPLAKSIDGKPERVNVAYNNTNTGTTNSSIQQTYPQPTTSNELKPDPKIQSYSLDKNGNLVPTDPTTSPQRTLASPENSEPNSTPIDNIAALERLSVEIADNPTDFKVTQNNDANATANGSKPKPTLSPIDKFLLRLDLINKNKSSTGTGLLLEISSLGKKKPPLNKPSLVTQAAASNGKPVGVFDELKQAWNKLWN